MVLKMQILRRLALGMSPKGIAAELGCLPAYVRAVRAREFGNGKEVAQRYRDKIREQRKSYLKRYYAERKAQMSA